MVCSGVTLPQPTFKKVRMPWEHWGVSGAREENRTPDLLITSELLCRLSYPGEDLTLPA